METIVIIGGGASGLVAGITAKTPTNEVIILEKNTSCGKKILATGNGHCNYYNDNQKLTNYHSTNNDLIEKLITEDNLTSVRDFFTSLGFAGSTGTDSSEREIPCGKFGFSTTVSI